ncbi:GNAT family N-acetyltransferase [Algibacter sp. R77976]|uniref:GNAT family N-acetyltransferase n=1 Tax=Algibacter sp. R77976 TaxID=3093873 RepID=UPI0037CA5C61
MYNLDFQTINDNTNIDKYNNILKKFRKCNTFYSLQYSNYTFDNNLNYFFFKKNNKALILLPVYLNKISSEALDSGEVYYDAVSPYGYSGPLFNESVDERDIKTFWNQVDNWYKENNVITEFIRFNLEFNHKYYSGHLIPSLNNVKGEIKNFEDIWSNFKQKVRNNYRKAELNNLRIVINSDKKSSEDIGVFYDIYIKTMVRNDATKNYFYTKSYFENLINLNQEKTVLVVVYKGEIPISTELLICNNDFLYSFLGGTLSDYFKYRPNDFLKIEVIKWAISNGKSHYILGGGRQNDDGLYQYKKSFFPIDKDVIFYTGRKIINQKIYSKLINQETIDKTTINNLMINPNNYFPIYREMQTQITPSLTVIKKKSKWDQTLKAVENYDFYHTFDYHELSKQDKEKTILLKYIENKSIVCIPLIIRIIENTQYFDATSVYGYSGPLVKNIDKNFDNANFIKTLNKYFQDNNIVSVFSRLNPYIKNQVYTLEGIGDITSLGNVVNIDLKKSLQEQRALYSKSTKNRINKIRKICDIIVSNKKEDIKQFIDIYCENMDRVNAKDMYYFPKSYYYNLVENNDIDILFALHKETNEYACAAMMVKTNNIIQYHISGTKNDYLNLSPIRILIDEMRIRGTNENYEFFNLGGGLGNNEDELFKFKSSFSKDFKPFSIWKLISMPDVYKELVNKKEISNSNINFFPLYRYEEAKN